MSYVRVTCKETKVERKEGGVGCGVGGWGVGWVVVRVCLLINTGKIYTSCSCLNLYNMILDSMLDFMISRGIAITWSRFV